MSTPRGKETEILDVGQELIQTRGYEGFSYRDIAERVDIRSASIHYYFPSKDDLVLAVARRYRAEFADSLAAIDADDDLNARERIGQFASIFTNTVKQGRVCLCAMLASDTNALPDIARREANSFFEDQEAWLRETLVQGATDGSLTLPDDPRRFARTFLAGLEGAMLMAHNANNPSHLDDVASEFIDRLRT